jgi:hypothetical protein
MGISGAGGMMRAQARQLDNGYRILMWFRRGHDTVDLANMFEIDEAGVERLLHLAMKDEASYGGRLYG